MDVDFQNEVPWFNVYTDVKENLYSLQINLCTV